MPALVVDQATGVTSVDVAVSAGLSVSGGPITTSGTITVTLDADLQAIAGLTSAADRLPYFTGVGTAALATFTAAGRALVDDADAAAQRTTLGLVIGTDVQAQDAELSALAGLTSAADKGIHFTGSGTAATHDLTSFARTILDDTDAAAVRSTIGAGVGSVTSVGLTAGTGIGVSGSPVTGSGSMTVSITDAELLAIAGLTSAANKGITFTGSGTAATYDLSAFALTILDDADAAAVRTTIGAAPTAGSSSIVTVGTLTGGATGAGFTVALATSTITGILGSANGGTANGFTKFTGPTTSEKTFALPNASATILTSDSVAQGDVFYGSAAGVVSRLTAGTSGQSFTTGGTSGNPSWTWQNQYNFIPNSGFARNLLQPGTEGSLTQYSDGSFCCSGGHYVLTQSNPVDFRRNVGDARSQYCAEITQKNASAQRIGFATLITPERAQQLRGQACRWGFLAKMSTSTTLRWALVEWTGAGASPTLDIVNDWNSSTYTPGNFFISTTTTVVATGTGTGGLSFAAANVSGIISSSCTNLILFIWTDTTVAQNVTLSVTEYTLSLGSEAKLWIDVGDLDTLRRLGKPGVFGGRLGLEQDVPVSTTNQTGKTSGWANPDPKAACGCGFMTNFEQGDWVERMFTATSMSFSGLTANLPYDCFGYFSGSTLNFDNVAWSSATARATALATQNGVYVKSGTPSRLWLGTWLMTGTTGQCEFSYGSSATNGGAAFVGLWNNYNPVLIECAVIDSTSSWNYNSATWRSKNGSTTNRITFVQGLVGFRVAARNCWAGVGGASSSDASGSLGLNSTSAVATGAGIAYAQSLNNATGIAALTFAPAIGTNYIQAIEARLNGANAATYYGVSTNISSSLNASIWC